MFFGILWYTDRLQDWALYGIHVTGFSTDRKWICTYRCKLGLTRVYMDIKHTGLIARASTDQHVLPSKSQYYYR